MRDHRSQTTALVAAANAELALLEQHEHAAASDGASATCHSHFDELVGLAELGTNTSLLIGAGALPVFLVGLTSGVSSVQRGALRALLAITLNAPPTPRRPSSRGSPPALTATPSGGGSADDPLTGAACDGLPSLSPSKSARVADSTLEMVLESVLGMAFQPGSAQPALQLLHTLAAQEHCAARLAR